MAKEQSIGSHNQQQGLPENRNQDTSTGEQLPPAKRQEPEKPAPTDDDGNLHTRLSNQANGYSEKKPTEPGNQGAESASGKSNKTYGSDEKPFAEGKPDDELPADPKML